MTVTKEIARLEKSNVKLTLTIGKEDIRSEYDGMLKEYTNSIQIPGFRKGKVPREVLVRKFGDALKQEALGRIIEKGVEEAFKDDSFTREDRPLPYSRPEVQDEPELDFENDLKFSVVYDVLPKITIEKWEGYEAEVPDVSITDEDISRKLETVRERNAIVLDKNEGDPAAANDVVTVNYCELSDSGEIFTETERQDFVFTLGSGSNLYKFDDEVTGMKKGEVKDMVKTYPEDFEDKDLAGKTKKLRVTLTALKSKKLPDLDDDLAQDVDEKFKSLDDLKKDIRDRLSKTLGQRIDGIRNSKILEKIMETTPVTIPDSMINFELDSRWRNLAQRFNTDAEGLHKIMEQQGGRKSQEVLDEWRPGAEKAIHSRLIVETLMENLKLEASDEEVNAEIESISVSAGESASRVRDYYQSDQMKDYIREDLKERKLYSILSEKNTVKPGDKVKYVDLIANNA